MTEEKVALVESVYETYGLNFTLAVIGLPKATWYYHEKQKVDYEEKYAHLKPILETIIREHPEYGVPRIMPELREVYDCGTNHKVVEQLLGIWELSIVRSIRRPKPSGIKRAITEAGGRANLVAQLDQIGIFQVATRQSSKTTTVSCPYVWGIPVSCSGFFHFSSCYTLRSETISQRSPFCI